MTVINLADRRQERHEPSNHYLLFGPDRAITGCGCGFRAHDDYGFGNSVVSHLLNEAGA